MGRPAAVSVPRAVGAFLLPGLLVVSAVAVALVWVQHRSATAEAVRDARTLTNLEAEDVVGPVLTDAALVPGPARDRLASVVAGHVLGSRILRVKIWDATGRIRYSDDAALIGLRFPLGPEERDAVARGTTIAEVSDLAAAENRDERQFGKLLQVYRGMRTPEGTPLLFETYQPYSVVARASTRMWVASLPALLGGLALLYLFQAPLAYRMARRLRRSQEEREALLVGTLAAADRERAAIAADLHDGVVQGLTGSSMSLAAAAERSAPVDPAAARAMRAVGADLRRWVRELRTLVVTVVPPTLHDQGLVRSLTDLAATLEVRGIRVTVAADGVGAIGRTPEVLLYRAAQEAVRNIVRHAEATEVRIAVCRPAAGRVRLTVRDDGRGLGRARDAARTRGSVGLELLADLARAQGGRLRVADAEGRGAELVLDLVVREEERPVGAAPGPGLVPGAAGADR